MVGGSARLLCLLALIILACFALVGQCDNDVNDVLDSDSYTSVYSDSLEDAYGYYDDADAAYYQSYGEYAADTEQPYVDYDLSYEEASSTDGCELNGTNIILSNYVSNCSLRVSGANAQTPQLDGGLDGIYELSSCYNGKPLYRRTNSTGEESRVLFYSSTYGDWDFARGTEPDDNIVVYGGDMLHFSSPVQVEGWQVLAMLTGASMKNKDEDFTAISLSVSCVDGPEGGGADEATASVAAAAAEKQIAATAGGGGIDHPLLTDEEIEAKYRYVYDKYGKSSNVISRNWSLVSLLILIGLAVVLATPRLVLLCRRRRMGMGMGKQQPVTVTTFCQLVAAHSRRKLSGHEH